MCAAGVEDETWKCHSSSGVEHSIRNRAVVGSIPTCGSATGWRREMRRPFSCAMHGLCNETALHSTERNDDWSSCVGPGAPRRGGDDRRNRLCVRDVAPRNGRRTPRGERVAVGGAQWSTGGRCGSGAPSVDSAQYRFRSCRRIGRVQSDERDNGSERVIAYVRAVADDEDGVRRHGGECSRAAVSRGVAGGGAI